LINSYLNNFLIIAVQVLDLTTTTNDLYSNFKLSLTAWIKANWNWWKDIP